MRASSSASEAWQKEVGTTSKGNCLQQRQLGPASCFKCRLSHQDFQLPLMISNEAQSLAARTFLGSKVLPSSKALDSEPQTWRQEPCCLDDNSHMLPAWRKSPVLLQTEELCIITTAPACSWLNSCAGNGFVFPLYTKASSSHVRPFARWGGSLRQSSGAGLPAWAALLCAAPAKGAKPFEGGTLASL